MAALRTIARNHGRGRSTETVAKALSALTAASCTTSSASVALWVSHLASVTASSSSGGTISRNRRRPMSEVGDHVGAVLRILEMKDHPGAGRHRLRIGQPLVERLLVPGDIRRFE